MGRALLYTLVLSCLVATSAVSLQEHLHKRSHALKHDHKPVRHSPISIELVRTAPNEEANTDVLLGLKLRQQGLYDQDLEMLQMMAGDVPLRKEVLKEKRLVTYYASLDVGGHKFRILLDTGSCEFWIPSSLCTTERCKKHRRFPINLYGPQKFRYDETASMSIEYLSGKVEGPFIYQDVGLGDVTVVNQVVGIANVVDIVLLDDVVWDGILGLAYPTPALLEKQVTPFFDTLMKQSILTNRHLANQFAYYINDEAGSITLGGANCDLIVPEGSEEDCISKFQFVPVTEQTYWTITLQDVRVKWPGKPVMGGFCPAQGCKTIVDTGTYLIYGPATQVHSMLSETISGCGDYDKMPDIMFDIKGFGPKPVTLTLRPIDYILKFKMDDRDDCVVGVSPDQDTIWTLGQVFLRSFYTIFDRDSNRVGFAALDRKEFSAIASSPNDLADADLLETDTSFAR